jgi:RND family efflux transporter MFP subunit
MKIKLLGTLILLAGGIGAWLLMHTAPVAAAKEKRRSAKVVQTVLPEAADRRIAVSAYGTVVPARELILRPEVGGVVRSHHPSLVAGGRVPAGATLFEIDDSDYRIALRQARTALAEAEAQLDLEKGRRVVAEREYRQLREDLPESEINRDLVLREPFRRSAEAAVEKAAAAIARAELDLARTKVEAPFNALVLEEGLEDGLLAEPGTPLATIAGSDAFWVRASIPLAQLDAIRLPEDGTPGATASVHLAGDGEPREGRVLRLLGDLDPAGRLARVIVEVSHPLDSDRGEPLLLGSYVRVEIDAGTLENVFEIPRHALREGERIWVVGPDRTLVIREPEILWRNEDSVFARNVTGPGEALIVSDLAAPLPGLALDPQPVTPAPDR